MPLLILCSIAVLPVYTDRRIAHCPNYQVIDRPAL